MMSLQRLFMDIEGAQRERFGSSVSTKLRSEIHQTVVEDTPPRRAGVCIPAHVGVRLHHRLNATWHKEASLWPFSRS